jgi:hypothetical protein
MLPAGEGRAAVADLRARKIERNPPSAGAAYMGERDHLLRGSGWAAKDVS